MSLPLDEIQGHVYPGFKKHHQAYLFVQFVVPCGDEASSGVAAPGDGTRCIVRPEVARGWLAALIPSVCSGTDVEQDVAAYRKRRAQKGDVQEGEAQEESASARLLNVAFSSTGLARLGAAQAELDRLPADFTSAPPVRASGVGDDSADYASWSVGGTDSTEPDAVVILAADSSEDLDRFIDDQRDLLVLHHLRELDTHVGHVLDESREHFGYKDNITKITAVMTEAEVVSEDDVLAGEFILGLDRYQRFSGQGQPLDDPDFPTWADRGSYLVFRKLEQQVHEFRTQTAAAQALVVNQSEEHPVPPGQVGIDLLRAKLIGRWPDGVATHHAPDTEPPATTTSPLPVEAAHYSSDPYGYRTPHCAHIRKVHPRDFVDVTGGLAVNPNMVRDLARNHRLLRRGITYGEMLDAAATSNGPNTRGVLFAAYQASISEQFEFVMKRWVNAPTFSMLDPSVTVKPVSPGLDAIIGVNLGQPKIGRACEYPIRTFLNPSKQLRLVEQTLTFSRFVIMRGGGYFLSPSLPNLQILAAGP